MKIINSVTAPNRYTSSYLKDRRAFSDLDTDYMKRAERRKQRHRLHHELINAINSGIDKEFTAPTMPVAEPVKPHLFLLPTTKPTVIKTVTVIRKRAFHRPLVETLQLAA